MRKLSFLLVLLALVVWGGCRAGGTGTSQGSGDADLDTNGDGVDDLEGNGNTADGDDSNANAGPGPAGGTEPEQGRAELEGFSSAEEFKEYFKEQVLAHNYEYSRYDDRWDEVDSSWGGEGEGEGEGEGPPGDIGFDEDLAAEEGALPPPGGDATGADDGDEDYSGTTIQEEGVDEADVVKTDGDYLYIVNDGWDLEADRALRIVRADPPEELELLSAFPLEGSGNDLYLVGDLAVALTTRTEYSDGGYGEEDLLEFVIDLFLDSLNPTEPDEGDEDEDVIERFLDLLLGYSSGDYWKTETIVTVIDVSDRSNPTMISQTVFEGSMASSRMIDGVLRLVVANYPDDYHRVLPLGMPQMEELFEFIDLDLLLPDYVTTTAAGETVEGNIVEWDAFFRPGDPDGFGVTTVITLDTVAPDRFDAVAIMAEPGLIYASTEALYVTDSDYYFDFRRVDTDVYKFAFEPDTVSLAGAGTVAGRILNQYSMGEYEGYLRVATTTDDLWVWETGEAIPSTNSVYVLGEEGDELAIVGSLEGLGVTEQIKSARFIGPRGYVVTFRQIDPLFTLDLSDPTNPRVVGELKVPGYSTFITPMGENHLLTVGVYADPEGWGGTEGVQLSIFDVSDFTNPQPMDNVVIGGWDTYSEATWNPKAFTYFAGGDLLALPIEHYDYGTDGWWDTDDWFETGVWPTGGFEEGDGAAGGGPRQNPTPPFEGSFQGLFVYRVTPEEGFDYLGRVSTSLEGSGGEWWYRGAEFTRGVFIGDHVYAVTSELVVAAPVDSLATVRASVEIGPDEEPYRGGGGSLPEPELPGFEGGEGEAETESDEGL